jgi:hypothetical protein
MGLGAHYGAESADIDLDRWNPAVYPFPASRPSEPPPLEIPPVIGVDMATLEAAKKALAAFPNAQVNINVNFDVTGAADPTTPAPSTPPPTGNVFLVLTTDKASGNVKLRVTPSLAMDGPVLHEGTRVSKLSEQKSGGLTWYYVTNGTLTGWIESTEAAPA